MFKITNTVTGKSILALNHFELIDRYESYGLPISNLTDLNTFRYWSYPYVGTAKILVSEQSFFDAGFIELQEGKPYIQTGDPQSDALDDIPKTVTLEIIGNKGLVTFEKMHFVQIERVMASLDNSLYSNNKLLILHLSQSTEDYSRTIGQTAYDTEFKISGEDGLLQYLPANDVAQVSKFYLPQTTYSQKLGYIADIQMATIYRSKGNEITKTTDAISKSDLKLTQYRLLYSRYYVVKNMDKFISISFGTKVTNTIELVRKVNTGVGQPEKDIITINGTTDFLFDAQPTPNDPIEASLPKYKSDESKWPMNNDSSDIDYFYPFYKLDAGATELDADAITIVDEIKDNAKKRLARSFHLVLEDILDIDPMIDLQQITYILTRNGPITELKTLPWAIPTYIELPYIEPSSSSIEFEIDSVTTDDDEESPYYNLQIATVTIRSASCELSDLIGTQVDVVDHSECLFDGANSVGLWGWATQRVAKSTASGADPSDKSPCHWAADNICC